MQRSDVLEDVMGMWKAKIILVANKLGVFHAIGNREASAKEIAKKVKAREEPLARLLNVLVGLDYLEKSKGKYSNAKKTRDFLLPSAAKDVSNFLLHLEDGSNQRMDLLEKIVKTDRPPDKWNKRLAQHAAYWRHYTYGMLDLAKLETPQILQCVTLPNNAKKLLDIGGAHGWHSMAFCKKNPGLKAVVLDFPLSVKFGKEVVKSQGMQNRVSFRIGDCTKDTMGRDYDVALLFGSLIQGYPSATTLRIFKNVHKSLKPKGVFILKIFCISEDGTKPFGAALYNLLIRIGLSKYGKTYTFREVRNLLQEAGFKNITKRDLPGSNILTGTRSY